MSFFVIDGVDGTGKATQTAKLVERLTQEGYQVETVSFPQYKTASAGCVEKYLGGHYGNLVNAYQASVFFAVDRYDASFRIRAALEAGKVVIADRYVSSNMGHQGGKIANESERLAYFTWNDDFEYRLMNLPRPTLTIVLDLPAETSQKLAQENADHKEKVAKDLHENDLEHLRAARRVYQEITERFPGFSLLSCSNPDQTMKTRDEVHQAIWKHILPHLSPPILSSVVSSETSVKEEAQAQRRVKEDSHLPHPTSQIPPLTSPLTNPWARLANTEKTAV